MRSWLRTSTLRNLRRVLRRSRRLGSSVTLAASVAERRDAGRSLKKGKFNETARHLVHQRSYISLFHKPNKKDVAAEISSGSFVDLT